MVLGEMTVGMYIHAGFMWVMLAIPVYNVHTYLERSIFEIITFLGPIDAKKVVCKSRRKCCC